MTHCEKENATQTLHCLKEQDVFWNPSPGPMPPFDMWSVREPDTVQNGFCQKLLLRSTKQGPQRKLPPLPPCLRFRKKVKRFCGAVEMLGRRRNTVKIGILAVFGPKPWTAPTPGRKRASGLIRRSAERARLGRPAGIRFSGVSAARDPRA